MRINYLAFFSPVLVLGCSSFYPAIDPPDTIKFELTCDDIGPFTKSDTGIITIHFKYLYKGRNKYLKVYEMLTGKYNGAVVSRYYTDYHTLGPYQQIEFDLDLSLYTFSKNKFMDIDFEIFSDASAESLFAKTLTIERADPLTIQPSVDGETIYYAPYSIINIGDGVRKRETYNFTDNSVVFLNDNYYEISLEGQKILYNFYKEFTYTSASLIFSDIDNLFKDINVLPGKKITVPLTIVQNNKELTFKFQNTFYVNPHTLHMSSKRKMGYVKTSRLYLPINKKEEIEGMKFQIVIKDAGCNKSTITLDVSYYSTRNLFGYCENSDYCITGGNV